ncbi:hypothetical protein [Leekyejoonella antrihumi]|uniref:hypothetical protein n=1 Tax=Leekyejoonella antrihumi TaxID=1660198 RepID=UPI001C963778|nr:hypothetical protein [Leekyejoonella antrihumi]
MLVSDLRHFLDLPDDAPGPARRLADQLASIVRAATAGPLATEWVSALHCRRYPRHRPCPGRVVIVRGEAPTPVRWNCPSCGDEGLISGWADSPFDLRQRRLAAAGRAHAVVVSEDTAKALRDLTLADPDCERLIFQIRSVNSDLVLPATAEDLEDLLEATAAEANHESDRRRRNRLDAAYLELENVLLALPSQTREQPGHP